MNYDQLIFKNSRNGCQIMQKLASFPFLPNLICSTLATDTISLSHLLKHGAEEDRHFRRISFFAASIPIVIICFCENEKDSTAANDPSIANVPSSGTFFLNWFENHIKIWLQKAFKTGQYQNRCAREPSLILHLSHKGDTELKIRLSLSLEKCSLTFLSIMLSKTNQWVTANIVFLSSLYAIMKHFYPEMFSYDFS